MKTIEVKQYVLERVLKTNVEFHIPEKPIYFQEWNQRIVIGIFPQKAVWDNNKVFELRIVQFSDGIILTTKLNISEACISGILAWKKEKNKSVVDILNEKVVFYLLNPTQDDQMSAEAFTKVLNSQICKLTDFCDL